MKHAKELQSLAGLPGTKQQLFNEMCFNILANYNELADDPYPYEKKDLPAGTSKNQPALFRLFDKLEHITFRLYSAHSIPDFLKRIVTKKPNNLGQPGEEKPLGKGHFRWDWQAYMLNDNEIKAIAKYIGVLPLNPAERKITGKDLYEFRKLDAQEQAIKFLELTGTTFTATFKEHAAWIENDNRPCDIFDCVLKNGRNRYRFDFHQSLYDSTGKGDNPPTAYDVLATIQKHEVGTFNDFCGDFGYNPDSRSNYKIYKAVMREWKNVELLFNSNQMELLREIQ